MLILTLHTLVFRDNVLILFLIGFLNTLFFIYEILQMSNGFTEYVTDIWNSLDIMRIASMYIYVILNSLEDSSEPLD